MECPQNDCAHAVMRQTITGTALQSLIPPFAFLAAADLIVDHESRGEGMQWGSLLQDPYPLGGLFAALVIDVMVYSLAAW